MPMWVSTLLLDLAIVTVHEKIDHNAGIIYFYLAPGMLSMTISALTVKVWWL